MGALVSLRRLDDRFGQRTYRSAVRFLSPQSVRQLSESRLEFLARLAPLLSRPDRVGVIGPLTEETVEHAERLKALEAEVVALKADLHALQERLQVPS